MINLGVQRLEAVGFKLQVCVLNMFLPEKNCRALKHWGDFIWSKWLISQPLLATIYFSGRRNCISRRHKILFPAARETILLACRTGETRMAANNPLVSHSLQSPRWNRPIRELEKIRQPMGELGWLHHQLPDTLLWFVRPQLEADIYIKLICGQARLNCLGRTIWVMGRTKEKSLPITLFAIWVIRGTKEESLPITLFAFSLGNERTHMSEVLQCPN